jgi:hypothetical protein
MTEDIWDEENTLEFLCVVCNGELDGEEGHKECKLKFKRIATLQRWQLFRFRTNSDERFINMKLGIQVLEGIVFAHGVLGVRNKTLLRR